MGAFDGNFPHHARLMTELGRDLILDRQRLDGVSARDSLAEV